MRAGCKGMFSFVPSGSDRQTTPKLLTMLSSIHLSVAEKVTCPFVIR